MHKVLIILKPYRYRHFQIFCFDLLAPKPFPGRLSPICWTWHFYDIKEFTYYQLILWLTSDLQTLILWLTQSTVGHAEPLSLHLRWAMSWDYGTFGPLYSSNVHMQPSSGARCLIFGRTLSPFPYFMCANSEGSGDTPPPHLTTFEPPVPKSWISPCWGGGGAIVKIRTFGHPKKLLLLDPKICTNEPLRDKTNKMTVRPAKTQISSLGIHSYVSKRCRGMANSEDPNQEQGAV